MDLNALKRKRGNRSSAAPVQGPRERTLYMIIQLFRKYGTISKIDFLWHTSGPKKGLPRGYCFVEFSSDEAANNARRALDGKQLMGRTLVVHRSGDTGGAKGAQSSSTASASEREDGDGADAAALSDKKVEEIEQEEQTLSSELAALKRKLASMEKDNSTNKRVHRSS